MTEIGDKFSQAVFKDFKRGYHLPDIAEKHGLTTRQVGQVVKFETAVETRVGAHMAKVAKRQAKQRKPK